MRKEFFNNRNNEFASDFDPLGSYTGVPIFPPTFEESALAEMESRVKPNQDADDL